VDKQAAVTSFFWCQCQYLTWLGWRKSCSCVTMLDTP